MIALSAGTARATTIDWGVHDSVELASGIFTSPASFDDRYDFTLTSGSLLLTVVTNDSPPIFDISGAVVELFTSGNTSLGTLTFDSTAANKTFSVGPGDYYYRVTGTVTGSAGSYLLSSAIPEPASAALVLMGLAMLGLRSRLRTN